MGQKEDRGKRNKDGRPSVQKECRNLAAWSSPTVTTVCSLPADLTVLEHLIGFAKGVLLHRETRWDLSHLRPVSLCVLCLLGLLECV
jgi:hypothetical protein